MAVGRHVAELVVRHRQHNAVVLARSRRLGEDVEAVLVLHHVRIGPGIVDIHDRAVGLQFLHDIHDPRVAHVGAVFLERDAKHQDLRLRQAHAPLHHEADDLGRHVQSHVVVDAPARQDHLRVVAHLLGLVGQVVGIDADAVAADQAGPERQEVPLGAGRLQDLQRVEAHAVEDQGQFVDQRDVHVTLGVLDDLGRLGNPDARCRDRCQP